MTAVVAEEAHSTGYGLVLSGSWSLFIVLKSPDRVTSIGSVLANKGNASVASLRRRSRSASGQGCASLRSWFFFGGCALAAAGRLSLYWPACGALKTTGAFRRGL